MVNPLLLSCDAFFPQIKKSILKKDGFFSICIAVSTLFSRRVDWSGCARLLREIRVLGRPHRRKNDEEAPGPPAESECLQWKSTVNVKPSKTVVDR